MKVLLSLLITILFVAPCRSQPSEIKVIGYYAGTSIPIDSFETNKLTHLIYCFGVLCENRFCLRYEKDSVIISSMVDLKKKQPDLKIMLSLGGWGGCRPCSEVFATESGRREFASSVKQISSYFGTDGIDLDWEYPVVPGFPGHRYAEEDKQSFSLLVKTLRDTCGQDFLISFAAGGFTDYIERSIDWPLVNRYVDFINILSYDLVHGYSKFSGHHTPLYSTSKQTESTDHAVKLIASKGIPANKLVIGAAFYGRIFQLEHPGDTFLYQPCHFSHTFPYRNSKDTLSVQHGFEVKWDEEAMAPYAINRKRNLLATYDDERSIALKTKYVKQHGLGGIMFWQLYDDKFSNGLLEVIDKNR
jgi:chitinase